VARTRTRALSRFGTTIEKAIKARGISAAELCREIGIHQTTLWRWMTSDTPPRADVAAAIASVLNCPLSAIVPAAQKGTPKPRAKKKREPSTAG